MFLGSWVYLRFPPRNTSKSYVLSFLGSQVSYPGLKIEGLGKKYSIQALGLKIESLQKTYSIQNWSLAGLWIEEVFSRPSIFNLQSTSTSLQRFPWVGTSDSTDMKKCQLSVFSPKPENGSESTANSTFYTKRSDMHPSLAETILTEKSRLYKQTLSFKGCIKNALNKQSIHFQ